MKSQHSTIEINVFHYFCLMMEGSGSGRRKNLRPGSNGCCVKYYYISLILFGILFQILRTLFKMIKILTLNGQVNELTLVLANHISDQVIDDVIEGLGKSYKVPTT
jgi:hypothetical protein